MYMSHFNNYDVVRKIIINVILKARVIDSSRIKEKIKNRLSKIIECGIICSNIQKLYKIILDEVEKMVKIDEVVIRLHNNLLKEKEINKESSPEMEIRPKNGITSATIITLLLDIEDELDIELDDYLPEIRKCKTIGLLIDIIKEAYARQH